MKLSIIGSQEEVKIRIQSSISEINYSRKDIEEIDAKGPEIGPLFPERQNYAVKQK